MELRALKLGETFSEAFNLYVANFLPLLLISMGGMAVAQIPSVVLLAEDGFGVSAAIASGATAGSTAPDTSVWIAGLVGGVVGFVVWALSAGILIDYIARSYLGKRATFRTSWRSVAPRLPRILGLMVCVWLAIVAPYALGFGAVLGASSLGPITGQSILVAVASFAALGGFIMTVYTALCLAFSVPAFVTERTKVFDAMRRSVVLSRGCRGRIFGYTFLAAMAVYLVLLVGFGVVAAFSLPAWVNVIALSPLSAVGMPFILGVVVILFYTAKIEREGYDVEHLAEQFPAEAQGTALP